MARPQRNNVDYYPFICKEGRGIFYIEQQYGNDGYATWIKILRQLAVTDYHYLNLSEQVDLMFLAAKCHIDEERLKSIINDLVKLGEFDKEFWEKAQIIYSPKFCENIEDAYSKRSNKLLTKEGLRGHLLGLGVNKLDKKKPKGGKNPHSIVEYNKEEDSKEEEIKELFEKFWNLYGKKVGKKTALAEWLKLTDEEINQIFNHVPKYTAATEKQFRKDPERYLKKKTFLDEVIQKQAPTGFTPQNTAHNGNNTIFEDSL